MKTFSNETSERYALALFELANENSELEKIEKSVLNLIEICEKNSNFIYFIKNPTNQLETHVQVFTKISDLLGLEKTLSNFLFFLIKKRRIYFLDRILKKFIKLSSVKKGKMDAILVSSKDLTQEEKKKISEEISQSVKTKLDFNYMTDKNLISGIKVQVGSLLIDTSVSNKLKKIKQSMMEN